ncbi:hypothetical protein Taro_031212, partial [Colocasia esculenta]|nr:hypothetical protein [Colocasia esculenta]
MWKADEKGRQIGHANSSSYHDMVSDFEHMSTQEDTTLDVACKGHDIYLGQRQLDPYVMQGMEPLMGMKINLDMIKGSAQVESALSFLANVGPEKFQWSAFEEACGVGIEVTIEEIEAIVSVVLEENMAAILEQRYRINGTYRIIMIMLLAMTIGNHKSDRGPKELFDKKLQGILGDRTAADDEKPVKKKKEKPAKVEEKPAAVVASASPTEEELNPYSIFPRPEENMKVHTEIFFSDGTIWRAHNTKDKLEKHLKITGGKVYTRFPPEPNGYLHIGHAKAMFIDFGLAKDRDGCCYLRFDDTNPEAEKQEYIDHIQEIVEWMGWKPFKVTYSSDYFQELYDLAVELIRNGRAYVDHQTPEEIKEYREKMMNSPWRDRPIAESLKLFDEMRCGLIDEGKATLRMKQDMQSDNKNMYDLIAYRIKASESTYVSIAFFAPHPHAGDKWCIYPSYDYTHCIVDSLENITHSLCTLEFEIRRPSYYWLLQALDLYQPYVWEYSRLNISNTVMSKRKLNRLVTEKWVDGWDDPRLMTLAGLRRRGVPFTKVIYIEQSDFRTKDSKDYYGLAPGKSVLLRYAFPIKCTEVVYDDSGDVAEIHAEYDPSKKTKPKGVLHWVAQPSPGVDPLKVEVRLFDKLFMSENPVELEDKWLSDLNPHSKEVIPEAYAVPSLASAVLGDNFQFERLGYFAVDLESRPEKLVFNRTLKVK